MERSGNIRQLVLSLRMIIGLGLGLVSGLGLGLVGTIFEQTEGKLQMLISLSFLIRSSWSRVRWKGNVIIFSMTSKLWKSVQYWQSYSTSRKVPKWPSFQLWFLISQLFLNWFSKVKVFQKAQDIAFPTSSQQ